MKLKERQKARILREKGLSLKQIAEALKVSKSSISAWVRNVQLTKTALDNIEIQKRIGRERSRKTLLIKYEKERNMLYGECKEEVLPFSYRDLWIAGIMLYAGEGRKSNIIAQQHVDIVNSDPAILRVFIKFLLKICLVSLAKIKVRLFLYKDIDQKTAQKYWASELRIPLTQFTKPFIKKSYSKRKWRRRSKYGTAHVVLRDVNTYRKIIGWLQAIYEFNDLDFNNRGVAQLGLERLLREQEVSSSNLLTPTRTNK